MKKNTNLVPWLLAVFFAGTFAGSLLSGGDSTTGLFESTASAQAPQGYERRTLRAMETIADEMRRFRMCQCR